MLKGLGLLVIPMVIMSCSTEVSAEKKCPEGEVYDDVVETCIFMPKPLSAEPEEPFTNGEVEMDEVDISAIDCDDETMTDANARFCTKDLQDSSTKQDCPEGQIYVFSVEKCLPILAPLTEESTEE